MSTPGPDTWAAAAAGAAATAAVVGLYIQQRLLRRASGIDILWRLSERWDGAPMQALRRRVSQELSTGSADARSLQDILNVFEHLGYVVRKARVLSKEDAWDNFSEWAMGYWYCAQDQIKAWRKDDDTVYETYAWLVEAFQKIERKKRKLRGPVTPTRDYVAQFLLNEKDVGTERANPNPT